MSFSKNVGDSGAEKSSPPARSACTPNDSSGVERQLEKGITYILVLHEDLEPALTRPPEADASNSSSRGPFLQSTLPAEQTDTANESERAQLKIMLEETAAGGSGLSGAASQRTGAASIKLVILGNPPPKPTESKAYSLDPVADFDVRRRQT